MSETPQERERRYQQAYREIMRRIQAGEEVRLPVHIDPSKGTTSLPEPTPPADG